MSEGFSRETAGEKVDTECQASQYLHELPMLLLSRRMAILGRFEIARASRELDAGCPDFLVGFARDSVAELGVHSD